jgi:hypothetical protein
LNESKLKNPVGFHIVERAISQDVDGLLRVIAHVPHAY